MKIPHFLPKTDKNQAFSPLDKFVFWTWKKDGTAKKEGLSLYDAHTVVQKTSWKWTKELSLWLTWCLLSGIPVWYVTSMLTPLYDGGAFSGIESVPAWGVVVWIVSKMKPKWW